MLYVTAERKALETEKNDESQETQEIYQTVKRQAIKTIKKIWALVSPKD